MKKRATVWGLMAVMILLLSVYLIAQIIRATPPAPPTPPTPPSPPAPIWKQVANQSVAIPGTDSQVNIGAWIEAGKDRYQSGETLTVVVAMHDPYATPLTVSASRGQNLVSVRVVLKGGSQGMKRSDIPLYFDSVDSLASYYASYPIAPPIYGWAIAWQPSSEQLTRLPRHVTIPVLNPESPSWMGPAWTEVGRFEIPHDEVTTWNIASSYATGDNSFAPSVYLIINHNNMHIGSEIFLTRRTVFELDRERSRAIERGIR